MEGVVRREELVDVDVEVVVVIFCVDYFVEDEVFYFVWEECGDGGVEEGVVGDVLVVEEIVFFFEGVEGVDYSY